MIKRLNEQLENRHSNIPSPNARRQQIEQLAQCRLGFAGIGTRKAKLRLNKLARSNSLAKAVRIALEIEDKNISAKKSYGEFRIKIYGQKTRLIYDLAEHCKKHNWVYGIKDSDELPMSHVIYFELPYCEQISWHFTPSNELDFPDYKNEWDGKINSTLRKLEAVARLLLR